MSDNKTSNPWVGAITCLSTIAGGIGGGFLQAWLWKVAPASTMVTSAVLGAIPSAYIFGAAMAEPPFQQQGRLNAVDGFAVTGMGLVGAIVGGAISTFTLPTIAGAGLGGLAGYNLSEHFLGGNSQTAAATTKGLPYADASLTDALHAPLSFLNRNSNARAA